MKLHKHQIKCSETYGMQYECERELVSVAKVASACRGVQNESTGKLRTANTATNLKQNK